MNHPIFIEFVSAQPNMRIKDKVEHLYKCLDAEHPGHVVPPLVVKAFDDVFNRFSKMYAESSVHLKSKRHDWAWDAHQPTKEDPRLMVPCPEYLNLYTTMEKHYPRRSRVDRMTEQMEPKHGLETNAKFQARRAEYLATVQYMRWTKAFNSIWRMIVRGTNERLDMENKIKLVTEQEQAMMENRIVVMVQTYTHKVARRHFERHVRAFVNRAKHDANFAKTMFQILFKNGKEVNIEEHVVRLCEESDYALKFREGFLGRMFSSFSLPIAAN